MTSKFQNPGNFQNQDFQVLHPGNMESQNPGELETWTISKTQITSKFWGKLENQKPR